MVLVLYRYFHSLTGLPPKQNGQTIHWDLTSSFIAITSTPVIPYLIPRISAAFHPHPTYQHRNLLTLWILQRHIDRLGKPFRAPPPRSTRPLRLLYANIFSSFGAIVVLLSCLMSAIPSLIRWIGPVMDPFRSHIIC